ncbi:protein NETWORKED 2D-like [Nymphaea colorata]|nr:protein NETWORKED 2D-like [Nymphaea colorata]
MLQRAASNAYSWWWASHIRTKQSNWLEQNLQDMETNLQTMLQLIEQDGDTFAQRAEMYYKKRPELIHVVQEFYKGYRAVAERYDHISGDLHNARSTIATVFPEQVPTIANDVDPPKEEIEQVTDITKNVSEAPKNPPPPPPPSVSGKSESNISKKSKRSDSIDSHPKMDKETAQKEIDKHQKEILVLQTEKEVFKSSYEAGLAKYWEVENQILELQALVCCLQEDHGLGSSIQGEEEQTLMAVTALRSCEQMLGSLQEEQKKSMAEAKVASEKIKKMEEKLKHFKDEFLKHQPKNNEFGDEQPKVLHPASKALEPDNDKLTDEQPRALYPVMSALEEEVCNLKKEKNEYQEACQKIVKHLELEVNDSQSFPELSHLIDELVGKVVNLEGEVSSQNVQILRLKTETDSLHEHFQSLQEGNLLLKDDAKTMNNRINELELELQGIQDLNLRIEEQKAQLQNHLAEACCNLDDLAGKMKSQQNHNEDENSDLVRSVAEDEFQEVKIANEAPTAETDNGKDVDKKKEAEASKLPKETEKPSCEFGGEVKQCEEIEESYSGYETEAKSIDETEESSSEFDPEVKCGSEQKSDVESFNFGNEFQNLCLELVSSQAWKRFLEGIEGKEKTLLTEYTSVLCKYNETKQKLSQVEKQNQDLSEKILKVRSLESTTARKDAEIESLKQKLSILQTDYEHPDIKSTQGNRLAGSKSHKLNSSRMLAAIGCLDYQIKENSEEQSTESARIQDAPATDRETKIMLDEEPRPVSAMEEKFRWEIDSLLEENLDFWIRFSASFHQIQKYQTAIQEAQVELLKLRKEKNVAEDNHSSSTHSGSTNQNQSIRSSVEAIQKQLRELQGELLVWIEQNALLKDELKHRSSSLCSILEEISQVSKIGCKQAGDLTDYQAAKFQGEVLNMQQENKKVSDELQAGLDHVRALQLEIEKNLLKLKENFGLSGSKHHHNNHIQYMRQTLSRTRIPLRTFIFGKPKKPSIFSCMNPALQKQYSDMRAGRKI